MAKPPKKLTTVSFTILGLLGLEPHTPYELARQVRRLAVFWSSAESVVYTEPKNLVAHGLARAAAEPIGKRSRTVYSITEAGRDALREWMAAPAGGPQIQFEAMLKVLFADAASRDDVLRAVAAIGEWAAITRAAGEAISADYLRGTPPYPDRAHIVALTMGYQIAFVQAVRDWVVWATAQIEAWDGTGRQPDVDLTVFELVVAGSNPVRSGPPSPPASRVDDRSARM